MRGSSGVTLESIPSATLQSFAAQRPYDLLVFHFGLNVASAKSQADNYKAYTHQMGEAIRHIRQAYPKASVLIVSVSDRDQRTSSGIHTMLGVESLVAHQQIMAADQQVAFFNLFQAMGGRESMKLLVDDGLANKDYTHLTFAGGRRLATKLVESIQAGVDNYKRLHP
jgi:lysophospholipase L1-like esterase